MSFHTACGDKQGLRSFFRGSDEGSIDRTRTEVDVVVFDGKHLVFTRHVAGRDTQHIASGRLNALRLPDLPRAVAAGDARVRIAGKRIGRSSMRIEFARSG